MKTRHTIDEHLSLLLPDDWEIWEATDNDLFVAAAPDVGRDEIQPHFVITRSVAKHESLQALLVGNLYYLQHHQKGYVEHGGTRFFEVDGRQIALLTYDVPVSEWIFTNQQYCLVVGRWYYLITCKSLPEQHAKWSGAFDEIARSLKIADGA